MRKLWNRPNLAVWSLVTADEAGVPNANICTYVTSISLEPKLLLVAVYRGTQTLDNLHPGATPLLQLLSEKLAPVVRICGRQSGRTSKKFPALERRFPIAYWGPLPYLADACGVLQLEVISLIENPGDHVLMLGRVLKSRNLSDEPILTTDYLRERGLIR
jgi:flavin reductase (DIM6/NTAB) family NADH-FMN oxidoreductase RutF